MSSIFTNYSKNQNASKLTREQKEEIKKVLQAPTDDNKIPCNFWSLPKLKNYISANFKIVYESDRSYHYLLKYCNFSWKLPSPFDINRNEMEIKEKMAYIKKEIEPLIKSED